jgi:hypothetical protein
VVCQRFTPVCGAKHRALPRVRAPLLRCRKPWRAPKGGLVRLLHRIATVNPLSCRAAIASIAFVLAGCASAPLASVVSLAPNGEFEWTRGRQVSRITNRNVDFYAAFERDRGEYAEWWVRIVNRSGHDQVVSPTRFYYRVAETESGGRNVTALDPNVAIAELDVEQASHAGESPKCEPYSAADFADDVATKMIGLDTQTPSEAKQACELRRAAGSVEQARREQWRELLANQTVRQSVLHVGESIEGLVLFPRLEYQGRTELILITQGAVARLSYQASLLGGS